MKHRLLPAIIITGCLAATLQAQVAEDVNETLYVALRGAIGRATLTGDHDFRKVTSFGVLPAVGYRFSPWFRTELEYAWRSKEKAETKTYSYSEDDEYFEDWDLEDDDLWGDGSSASLRYNVHSLMLQCYVDIPLGDSPVQPFVNAGIGATFGKVTAASSWADDFWGDDEGWEDWECDPEFEDCSAVGGSSGRKNSTCFSWNVGAGLSFYLTDSFAIDAMYRYSDLGKFKAPGNSRLRIKLHEGLIGARFAF